MSAVDEDKLDRLIEILGGLLGGLDQGNNQIIHLVKQGEVLLTPYEEGGLSRMCADLSLARELLGYRPKYSLAEGLRLTYERDPHFQTVPVP